MSVASTPRSTPFDFAVAGAFGPQARARLYPAPGYRRVVINLHGSFGNLESDSGKYRRFAETLQKAHANVILFESSRLEGDFSGISDPFERKKARFSGKGFAQELEDHRRLLQATLDRSEEFFGTSADELQVSINGNSIGGILAFFLAAEFPQIQFIFTVGTGLRESLAGLENNGLVTTMPPLATVRERLAAFAGGVQLFWGTNDALFASADVERLEAALTNARVSGIFTFLGVDHSFGTVDGMATSTPYNAVTWGVILSLVTGEAHSMLHDPLRPGVLVDWVTQTIRAKAAGEHIEAKYPGTLQKDDGEIDTELP